MYYSGRVHAVKYADPTRAFYIVLMSLDKKATVGFQLFSFDSGSDLSDAPVSVKGCIPGMKVDVGAWFGFEGEWEQHPKYGDQLHIKQAPIIQDDWTSTSAINMMSANGVGSQVMNSILAHFGEEGLIGALEDAVQLESVPGLTKFSAQHIADRWCSLKAHFKGLMFISALGLPAEVIESLWAFFGTDTQKVLVSDPWQMVKVDGISFAQADEVARKQGIDNLEARIRGAVLYACKSNRTFGHLFQRPIAILNWVRDNIPDVSSEMVLEVLAGLHKSGELIIDRDTREKTTAVYEPWSYKMETLSASLLLNRNLAAKFETGSEHTLGYMQALGSVGPQTDHASNDGDLECVVRMAIQEWGEQAHLVLSGPQKEGVYHALMAPVSILSGLPGTGKTTSLQAAVRIFQDAGVPFLLCAPTGIAAKNLSARTGALASTIHRALGGKGSSDERRESTYVGIHGKSGFTSTGSDEGDWVYNKANPHPADVVIIDEASMVDQYLLYRLLDGTKPTARLVFVGDHAQLPSVGPGNVLRDLINSRVFPTVKLTQIFRQDDASGIVFAAHSMVNGRVPSLNKDFKMWHLQSEDDVLDAVLKMGGRLSKEGKDFQILSPKHNGTVGVTNLNTRLRELINPASRGQAEARLGGGTIREGDRVMVVKNDYILEVFNGDVGRVTKVDLTRREVEVEIFGAMPVRILLKFAQVSRLLRLAYACTVHKSQGLEYDTVVMPLVMGFHLQLQRNLLYTAITRAKKQVFLVGQSEALSKAVANAREDERATLFLDRLGGVPVGPTMGGDI